MPTCTWRSYLSATGSARQLGSGLGVLRDLLADAPSSPDSWADGRSIVTDLAEAGHRFTGYRVAGRLVLEIECECECCRACRSVPGRWLRRVTLRWGTLLRCCVSPRLITSVDDRDSLSRWGRPALRSRTGSAAGSAFRRIRSTSRLPWRFRIFRTS